ARAAARRGDERNGGGHVRGHGWSHWMGRIARRVRVGVFSSRPYHRRHSTRVITTTAKRTSALRARPFLGAASVVALFVALWMALVWSPPDAAMGNVVRILYVHVANAWLAYLAFVVVFISSVAYLWTKQPAYDAIGVASAEIGVLFTDLTLVLGWNWAVAAWGGGWGWGAGRRVR